MANYDQLPLYQASASGESLITSVSDRLGLGTAPSSADKNRIRNWLNQIQKVVSRRHNWSSLVRADSSLVAVKDVLKYTLPPHIKQVLNARLIDDTTFVLDDAETAWTVGVDVEPVAANPSSTESGLHNSLRRTGKSSMKFLLDISDAIETGVKLGYSELKSGSITTFADAGSGRTTITSASHNLSNGDRVTITGSTNYDGTYTVINSATTFDIKKTYTAETPSSVLWYRSETAVDLSSIQTGSIGYWVYTDRDIGLEVGDIEIVVTEDALGAKSTNYVQAPNTLIQPYEWTYVQARGLDFTDVDVFNSVGLFWAGTQPTGSDFSIYIDGINVYKESFGGSSWPLKIAQAETLDRIMPNPEYITGFRPTVMAISGLADRLRSYELYRIPDANYPIWMRYVAWPEEFPVLGQKDAMVCDIPDIDDVLIFGATWLGMSTERNWESAGQMEGAFRRALSEAKESDEDIDGWVPIMNGGSDGRVGFGDLVDVPAESAFDLRGATSGFFYLW